MRDAIYQLLERPACIQLIYWAPWLTHVVWGVLPDCTLAGLPKHHARFTYVSHERRVALGEPAHCHVRAGILDSVDRCALQRQGQLTA